MLPSRELATQFDPRPEVSTTSNCSNKRQEPVPKRTINMCIVRDGERKGQPGLVAPAATYIMAQFRNSSRRSLGGSAV